MFFSSLSTEHYTPPYVVSLWGIKTNVSHRNQLNGGEQQHARYQFSAIAIH